MTAKTPPPFAKGLKYPGDRLRFVWLGAILLVVVLAVGLRLAGLIRAFSVPTEGMSPTVSVGDHVMMEGFTFLFRQPRRGDVVVFRTDGVAGRPPETLYLKRIAGEPGDRVRLEGGELYINERHVIMSNAAGEIRYLLPRGVGSSAEYTNITVPIGHYFVLGDNSSRSMDSRFWGGIPRECILGRMAFCF